MSDELIICEFLECDLEENAQKKRKRLETREDCNPFDLGDMEFIRRYRLSKELVLELCEELQPMTREPTKSTDIQLETKVLTALSFYAFGSYQRPIGDISAHSIAQQTVSSAILQITEMLNSTELRNKYIKFPKTPQERNAAKTLFFNKFGMPGVLGCIDGTHIEIVRPTEHEERYYCRKQYHSLNVQLICDANMQIISVDSSFGGATHDSFIWNCHPINTYMNDLNETTWLLGDSGYPLRKYMMTPVVDAADGTPESHYTYIHVRTRNVIERTIGLLKARFRCLLDRSLNYTPETAGLIVNACAILHNICNKANLPILDLEEMNEERVSEGPSLQPTEDIADANVNNPDLRLGIAVRQRLIQRLWAERTHRTNTP